MKKQILTLILIIFLAFGCATVKKPSVFDRAEKAGKLTIDAVEQIAYLPLTGGTLTGDLTLGAGKHLVLPLHNDPITPTLAFGDGNSGFYESVNDTIGFATGGLARFSLSSAGIDNITGTNRFYIKNAEAAATAPIYSFHNDSDTGLSAAAADAPAIISGGVPSQVWGTKVTLTTAQLNTLRATPITIVAAQGANTIIEVVSVVLTYDYATAAFTVGADEDLVIEYADGTDATTSIETAGFLDQVDDEVRFYKNVLADGADLKASINQALQIKNTGAGETADGGGELDVRIVYRVYATGF